MKKLIIAYIFLAGYMIINEAKAQLNHFIYFQTENKQPFYAKLDNKVYSSSASGYLIIPKLVNGNYQISIGFPKPESEEQHFICIVNKKDEGYLVKNFADKGWALFNLQSLELSMAENKNSGKELALKEKDDAFSAMLSDAVNDPTIKQKEILKESKKNTTEKETQITEIKNVNALIVAVDSNKQKVQASPEPRSEKPVIQVSAEMKVIKKTVLSDKEGYEMVFIDVTGREIDTITVLIPFDELNNSSEPLSSSTGLKENIIKTEAVVVKAEVGSTVIKQLQLNEQPNQNAALNEIKADSSLNEQSKEIKFLPIELPSPNTNVIKHDLNKGETKNSINSDQNQSVAVVMINSDCKVNATEDDFFKLRKKMAGEDSADAMISTAKKYFKLKCFTTVQIKNLSVLFLKDANRYTFFDLAYQYVSDSHNYNLLESQLTDPYYLVRFKSMLRH